MMDSALRTILIYIIVLAAVRLMGKRGVGQFSPFDFVVAIIVAEIATMPLASTSLPLWHSIVPLAMLALLEIVISFAALHSRKLRILLDGKPQVVIRGGHILKNELRKARYNLDDLLSQLRESGYPKPEDIEVAVLETSGRISVVPKAYKRPMTPEDLGLSPPYEGLPAVVIMDGEICTEKLDGCNLTPEMLEEKLKELGLNCKKVFLATVEKDGRLFISIEKPW